MVIEWIVSGNFHYYPYFVNKNLSFMGEAHILGIICYQLCVWLSVCY
uniref:Uncharacterized protein n=1 Tax=Rhizophora mucronata TaxID=61149 RepID=A0A2P2MZY9_RHIMU